MCKPTVVQWSNQSPDPQTTATTKQQRQYPEPNFAFDFMPRCDLPREYYSGEWSLVPSPVIAVFLRLTHFAEEFRSGPGWWEWKTSPEIPPFDLYFHVAASFAVDWLTQRVKNKKRGGGGGGPYIACTDNKKMYVASMNWKRACFVSWKGGLPEEKEEEEEEEENKMYSNWK